MTDAALMWGDPSRSADLFNAIPAPIFDPFLYVEVGPRRVAVVGSLDRDQVQEASPDLEIIDPDELGFSELRAQGHGYAEADLVVAERACQRLGVRRAAVPPAFPVELADHLRGAGVELVVDRPGFEDRRRVKSAHQIAGIRRAQTAADLAMGAAVGLLRDHPGVTAEQIRVRMQEVCDAHGADLGDDAMVTPGVQALDGHSPGSGPITPGVPVVIDIWPRDRTARCFADMSRTFCVGHPPDELRRLHDLCLRSLLNVTAAVRAGVNGRELYDVSCEPFEAAGEPTRRTAPLDAPLASGYNHALGHGLGLEIHEPPAMSLVGDDLVAGDVIAVEPGCYHPGFGGCRLEDTLLVTADGCEVLPDFPYGFTP